VNIDELMIGFCFIHGWMPQQSAQWCVIPFANQNSPLMHFAFKATLIVYRHFTPEQSGRAIVVLHL
jgi:hypothetical protein